MQDKELAAVLGRNIDDPMFNISTYVLNLLYNLPGTRTIGNLVKYSAHDLRQIDRFGPGSVAEVEQALDDIFPGLKLAQINYKDRI